MAKTLIILGILIVITGVLWPWLSKFPLGHLPGDIVVKRDNFSLYVPITSMLLISALASFILWLINR